MNRQPSTERTSSSFKVSSFLAGHTTAVCLSTPLFYISRRSAYPAVVKNIPSKAHQVSLLILKHGTVTHGLLCHDTDSSNFTFTAVAGDALYATSILTVFVIQGACALFGKVDRL